MIDKVAVTNFKKFEHLEFEVSDHLVIAAPNNFGKTTLLQAVASWSELAYHWMNTNPDLVRDDDGNYPGINLNLLKFHSVPLADFNHLWQGKNTQETASIWLHAGKWRVGFEILYKEQELAYIRPSMDVAESDLESLINEPLVAIYVPPLSGLDISEAPYDPIVIPARLARAQAGSVLRNLLLAVSRNLEKWQALQEIADSFFGYELLAPSAGTAEIYAGYRHTAQDTWYNLSSAASGFLQVLLVYAALLHREATVVLIDEPDAHLHILLQGKMYDSLRRLAGQNRSQLIVATHSERLIDAADEDSLRLLAGGLRKIDNASKLADTMHLENTEIMLAETEPGILYIEGATDIPLLREWARVVGHRLLPFLEKPFGWQTAENKWPAVKHFSAMRMVVSTLRGVELCDRDDKEYRNTETITDGLIRITWKRREIENYLIHPESITRFVRDKGGEQASELATQFMKREFPPVVYEEPFELSGYARDIEAKILLGRIFVKAGLEIKEVDYYEIAAQMEKDEIHPEVIEKLDTISGHFNIPKNSP